MNEALTYPVGGSALLAHNGVRRSCLVFISPYRDYQREMTTEQSAVHPPRSRGDEGGVPWVLYSLCTRGDLLAPVRTVASMYWHELS